ELAETYRYNEAGQLIRFTDARRSSIDYFYHSITSLTRPQNEGDAATYTQKVGGYLARIVRNTGGKEHVTNDYHYDVFGNLTAVLDGKLNPTRFEYDAQNRLIKTTSRKPFEYQTMFRYDANGNLLEQITSFDHYEFNPVERRVVFKKTTAYQRFEYNSLNNLVRRTVAGGGREITHTWIRNANENIVRTIQPMGNVIQYEYDERGLLIAQRLGAQTRDESETRYTYTRNGRLRSRVDSRGNTDRHDYDGFNRYKG